ncbi:MAG: hypothetical protein RLY93_09145 [Sumerlaeia bacterium]
MTRSRSRRSLWHNFADLLAGEQKDERQRLAQEAEDESVRVIAMRGQDMDTQKEFLTLCQALSARLAQSALDVYEDNDFPKVKYSPETGYRLPGEWMGDDEPRGRLLDPAAALRGWAQKADAEEVLRSEATARLLQDLDMSVVEAKSSLQTRRSLVVALGSLVALGIVAALLVLARAMNPIFIVTIVTIGFFFAFRASLPAWGNLKKEEFVKRLENALHHVNVQKYRI